MPFVAAEAALLFAEVALWPVRNLGFMALWAALVLV
jgi:hypothetical protein